MMINVSGSLKLEVGIHSYMWYREVDLHLPPPPKKMPRRYLEELSYALRPQELQPQAAKMPSIIINLCWGPVVWIPIGSPKMKGIGILGCTPIRIPNHRDPNQPNQQLTIG